MAMNPRELQRMMQQAQKMQEQLALAQDDLAAQEFEGSAGGGVVKVRMSGAGDVLSVDIDPSVIDPDDREMLGDLIVAAANQAHTAVRRATEEQLGGITGGLEGLLG